MDNYHSKDMLNKISKLNNQLTNMSRDLNKKNYHLKEEIERRYIAEQNLRTLLNATEDIIVLIQKDETILDSNMGFVGFVDREYDALIGRNYIEVLPATLQESISAVFHKAAQEGVLASCEEHVNGHWYEFSFYPLTDTENNLERIACYQQDTTERKEMYSYLVNASKQEAAETIVSGIAHDVNNIMTVLLGYLAIIEKKGEQNEALSSYFSTVNREGGKIIGLVNKLLYFIQGQHSSYADLDVNDLLHQLIEVERKRLNSDIKVDFNPSREAAEMQGDKEQILDLFRFLFTNCVEALDGGGSVKIDTELKADTISISISDNGVGMDEHTLSRAFEPFFSTKFLGRGLGLSASYGIVKSHGGSIDLISKPQEGTTVRISLPFAQEVA